MNLRQRRRDDRRGRPLTAAAAALRAAPLVDVLERDGQQIELLLPVFAVAVDPDRRREHRPRHQAAAADAPGPLLPQQAGAHPKNSIRQEFALGKSLQLQERVLEIGAKDMVTMLDLIDDGGKLAGQPTMEALTEDRGDLVGCYRSRRHVALTLRFSPASCRASRHAACR